MQDKSLSEIYSTYPRGHCKEGNKGKVGREEKGDTSKGEIYRNHHRNHYVKTGSREMVRKNRVNVDVKVSARSGKGEEIDV